MDKFIALTLRGERKTKVSVRSSAIVSLEEFEDCRRVTLIGRAFEVTESMEEICASIAAAEGV